MTAGRGGASSPPRGSPPTPGSLPEPGEIDVWMLDVTAPWLDALADAGVASEEERARADRMPKPELARALLARRSALRFVLARYLGLGAASVDLVTAPGGKPVLLPSPAATLGFSVGHSGDLYGIAVATSASVGFDVERLRSVPRAEAIAGRWFGDEEARGLEGLVGEELERRFMRLWTGKEALAKRHGAGLRLMMRGDTTELDTAAAASAGRLRWLTPAAGYEVAVACARVIQGVALVRPGDDSWIR